MEYQRSQISCPCMPNLWGNLRNYDGAYISQKTVLVIGVGNQSDAERWNNFTGPQGYAWESLDLQCEIPNCYQINFNDIAQLDTLPDNHYDIIALDRSMQFFVQDWTYEHLLILKKKLKMNGEFFLSVPSSYLNTLPDYVIRTNTIQEASEQVYSWLQSDLIHQLSSSDRVNLRFQGNVPNEIYIEGQRVNSADYRSIVQPAEERIMMEFTLFNTAMLTAVFGYAEYRDRPTGYFAPDVENDQRYYSIRKTTEQLNIAPEIVQQYPQFVNQPLQLLNVLRDDLVGSIFFG